MDTYGKNTTETLYLRKWADDDKAQGKPPYEIVVVTQVTIDGMAGLATQTTYTDPGDIAYHNEQAERAEKGTRA